jgi:predicted RNA binding protein YcfA (HicA-like mRNA interferase family)
MSKGTISIREYISFLEKIGFSYARSSGTSHAIYKHPDGRVQDIIISDQECNMNYVKNLLRHINVSFYDFERVVNRKNKKRTLELKTEKKKRKLKGKEQQKSKTSN